MPLGLENKTEYVASQQRLMKELKFGVGNPRVPHPLCGRLHCVYIHTYKQVHTQTSPLHVCGLCFLFNDIPVLSPPPRSLLGVDMYSSLTWFPSMSLVSWSWDVSQTGTQVVILLLSLSLSLSPSPLHLCTCTCIIKNIHICVHHNRIYVAYVTFYLLGLVMSMQVPFVGFQPIRTSEHMAAAGVFALLNAYGLLKYLQARLTGRQFKKLFFAAVVASAGLVFVLVVLLTYLGYVAPWSGRFYSLWDTG